MIIDKKVIQTFPSPLVERDGTTCHDEAFERRRKCQGEAG